MSNDEIKNLYLDSYRRENFFIGGQWVKPNSKNVIEIISPSTEALIGQVPDANTADIDLAVKAASAAFAKKNSWSTWAVTERTKVMRKFADIATRNSSRRWAKDPAPHIDKAKWIAEEISGDVMLYATLVAVLNLCMSHGSCSCG